ncbi:hypothetical protein BH09PAT4_BH09PAT4_00720 [soil metagenome]
MAAKQQNYPVNLDVDYPKQLDRFTSFFRLLWSIPVLIVLAVITMPGGGNYVHEAGKTASSGGTGIAAGLFVATALLLVFRQRYPRWWFDFALELNRFSARVGAYLFLLTDRYPSTEDKQSVHLDITYPNVKKDLNRWLPLVKWFLAIPHYFALLFLAVVAAVATVIAWFAILITGRYPKGLFDFVVGVGRWSMRVNAYAFLLVTDKYPPFTLK